MEFFPLNEETIDLEIDLCLKCHPSGFVVPEDNAEEGRQMKRAFLKKVFSRVKPAGFIAAENGMPIALLELMPREFARLNGYITGTTGCNGETLTIVCLEVASNQNRNVVMDRLVEHLVENPKVISTFQTVGSGSFSQRC